MKVIFLDRDGVINKYPGDNKYVTHWKEFKFFPNSIKAIKKLNQAGFKVFVISNQAGIRKKIYTNENLKEITKRMLGKIREKGGRINKVFYCLHTEEDGCNCRKPKIGLIQQALEKFKTSPDLKNTFLIGDSIRDIQTGKNAGLKTILVLSGKEKLANKDSWQEKPHYVCKNLFSAVNIVLNESPRHLRLSRSRA